jgi:hypothetical protein
MRATIAATRRLGLDRSALFCSNLWIFFLISSSFRLRHHPGLCTGPAGSVRVSFDVLRLGLSLHGSHHRTIGLATPVAPMLWLFHDVAPSQPKRGHHNGGLILCCFRFASQPLARTPLNPPIRRSRVYGLTPKHTGPFLACAALGELRRQRRAGPHRGAFALMSQGRSLTFRRHRMRPTKGMWFPPLSLSPALLPGWLGVGTRYLCPASVLARSSK